MFVMMKWNNEFRENTGRCEGEVRERFRLLIILRLNSEGVLFEKTMSFRCVLKLVDGQATFFDVITKKVDDSLFQLKPYVN
jgi:hypothetical protein